MLKIMPRFLILAFGLVLIGEAALAQSSEAEEQAMIEAARKARDPNYKTPQEMAQLQAQQFFSIFKILELANAVQAKCKPLADWPARAASISAVERRQALVLHMQTTTDAQLDQVSSAISNSIAAHKCSDLIQNNQVKQSLETAEFTSNQFLLFWKAYQEAATGHAFLGGDLSDYDCGLTFDYADVQSIYPLTQAAEQKLKENPGFQEIKAQAKESAYALAAQCQRDPSDVMVMIHPAVRMLQTP